MSIRSAFLCIDQVCNLKIESQIWLEVLRITSIFCVQCSAQYVSFCVMNAHGVRMYLCRGVWGGSVAKPPKRSRAAIRADAASSLTVECFETCKNEMTVRKLLIQTNLSTPQVFKSKSRKVTCKKSELQNIWRVDVLEGISRVPTATFHHTSARELLFRCVTCCVFNQ